MIAIKNIDIIQDKIIDWQISDIAYIKMISLLPSENCKNLFLDITFLSQKKHSSSIWPDIKGEFDEISLLFYDVSNFNCNFEGEFIPQLMGFDIVDISDQGWESIKFQIEDYEDGIIGFYCREIEVKSIAQSVRLNW